MIRKLTNFDDKYLRSEVEANHVYKKTLVNFNLMYGFGDLHNTHGRGMSHAIYGRWA